MEGPLWIRFRYGNVRSPRAQTKPSIVPQGRRFVGMLTLFPARRRRTLSDDKTVMTRIGEAVDAAKEKASEVGASIARKAGKTLRTTNGMATSVCASGIKIGDARKFKGGSSNAMINPNPSVTALVARGSMNRGSSKFVSIPFPRDNK